MIRISAFIWIIVLALLGVGLFQVKYNVQSKESELRGINKKIEANRSAIHVLEAEWSYLNDPTRLADLTRRHTDLTPTQATQLKHFADLPPRPATAQPDLPALTPPLVSSTQPVQQQPASNVIPASVTSPATALPTNGVANAVPDAGNAAGAKAVVTQVSAKSSSAAAAPATPQPAAAGKPAASTVAKPQADEVIDAILSDMQRQQQAAPAATAGDQ
jgi:hypothetical protein